MKRIPFIKMHGAGNDMVVIDARHKPISLSLLQIQQLAHRRYGIGCDQLLLIEEDTKADISVRIYNADGTEVSMCGNGARCVAWLLFPEYNKPILTMRMGHRILQIEEGKDGIDIAMGTPSFLPEDIPLAANIDPFAIDLGPAYVKATALSMGNPHLVAEIAPGETGELQTLVDLVHASGYFPEGVNIHLASRQSNKLITAQIWERGVGPTLACGSGASATAVAMMYHHPDLPKQLSVQQPGGILKVRWEGEGKQVYLSGPVACTFKGEYLL